MEAQVSLTVAFSASAFFGLIQMFIIVFLCTIDSSQQISDFFLYKTLISMVDYYGEKTT